MTGATGATGVTPSIEPEERLLQSSQFVTSNNINVSILDDAVYVIFPGDMESQLDMCTIDS